MRVTLAICFICTLTIPGGLSDDPFTPAKLGVKDERPTEKLERVSTFPELLTLSGFTSGGGFAQQLQISYSSLFSGIAVFQHAFYRCGLADGIAKSYDDTCTRITKAPRENLYDPQRSIEEIKQYHQMGVIEDPNNLRNTKLYVYTGTLNWVHSPDFSLRILNVYEPYIQNPNAIKIRAQAANLSLPTNHFGGPCSEDATANYQISNCGLNGPFEALQHLLGSHVVKCEPPVDREVPLEPLRLFDQSEFTKDLQEGHLMDTTGYFYIPKRCKDSKCLIHFYFHGCAIGREFVGDKHIRNSGYLEIAEMNDIIMVFPQALSNSGENGYGCWDTYGLNGKFYATQRGLQVTAVRNMITRLLGQDAPPEGRAHPHGSHPRQRIVGHS